MIDGTTSRMAVECTVCEFSLTLTRSDRGWSADGVADHAEQTGHRLRAVPLDADRE